MALESGTYIDDLNQSNPDGGDGKSEGDNHLRLIKEILIKTFDGIAFPFAFASIGGAANVYTATLNTAPASYIDGMAIYGKIGAGLSNTAAATLNVNSLGAKAIKKYHNVALASGDLEASGTYWFVYNGTDDVFELLTPTANIESRITALEGVLTAESGTAMLFMQNAAPTGWSFSAANDDRVIMNTSTESEGGDTGGSWTISDIAADSAAGHTHSFSGTTAQEAEAAVTRASGAGTAANPGHTHTFSGTSGSGGGHTHTITHTPGWRPQFVKAITCTKD